MTSKPLLRYGSTGPAVVELQTRLNAAAGGTGAQLNPDGIFGPKTLARVKAFQVQGTPVLVADGIVGPLTWSKLLNSAPDNINVVANQIRALAGSAPYPMAHLIALAMAQQGGKQG